MIQITRRVRPARMVTIQVNKAATLIRFSSLTFWNSSVTPDRVPELEPAFGRL
jgi:hypothetical protein